MAEEKFTGGMIALVPSEADVDRLALDGGEEPAELHLTLIYLGDAEEIPEAERARIVAAVERAAADLAPIQARVFAHATFNPDGHDDRDPCAVYLVGDSREIEPLRAELDRHASEEQHAPFVPHVTAGYGLTAADLSYIGPVTFDAIRVALGEVNVFIPLTGGETFDSGDEDDSDESAGGDDDD